MAIAECTGLIIDRVKVYCIALANITARVWELCGQHFLTPKKCPWTRYISPPEPQVVTKSLMRSIACLHVAVVTFLGNRRSLRGAVPPPPKALNADPQLFPSRKSRSH